MCKEVKIDYLYLDLETCDRCIGTDEVLEEVIAQLTPALELAGLTVAYRKTEISTQKIAEQYCFLSSPTIRVNGTDICEKVSESSCGCCGEISGTDVDCRLFEYEGKTYEVPPKAMLARGILRNIFSPTDQDNASYILPENLRAFFDGKESKQAACSCKNSCCS